MALSDQDKSAFRAVIDGTSTLGRPDRWALLARVERSPEALPSDLAAIVRGPMAYTTPEATNEGYSNPPTTVTPPTSYGFAAQMIRGRLSVST